MIAFCCSLLAGCSAGSPAFPDTQAAGATTAAGPEHGLGGHTHGGQQPIAGAKIYLLAAGTTGYGSAATSLLTSASYPGYAAQQDTNGNYYVLTDASGSFQIVDTCTPGQQVYVVSAGGNPGAGPNSAAVEIALLGQCPSQGNFDNTLTGVFISEISTVAAAYAASAYATDPFHIGGPNATALQQTGIANAFANAANLFDVQNINDLARQTTLSGNGTVPQVMIHTTANILASCVNSAGPSSPSCSLLFSNTLTDNLTQTQATDTTTAAIRIAHHPWANVSTLFSLQMTNSPFSPQQTSAPNDLSLGLTFGNAALGSNPSLAVDAGGNVWTVVPGGTAVSKLSPMGARLSGAAGYAIGGGFTNARGIALDTSNNVWILGVNSGSGFGPGAIFAELNNTGVYQNMISEYTGLFSFPHPPTGTTNLAMDGAGNFYYSANRSSIFYPNCCTEKFNYAASTFTDLDPGDATPGTNFVAVSPTGKWSTGSGNSISQVTGTNKLLTGAGLNAATGVALDASGDIWAANSGGSSLSEFSSTGTVLSGTTGFTGGGLSTPKALAICGLGYIWATNSAGTTILSQFTNAGAPLGTGYGNGSLTNAGALAIDGSGNIWVASATSSTIVQFLGIAAPVVTPMAAAVSSNSLGARP